MLLGVENNTGKNLGFGIVEFEEETCAREAKNAKKINIKDHWVTISPMREKRELR